MSQLKLLQKPRERASLGFGVLVPTSRLASGQAGGGRGGEEEGEQATGTRLGAKVLGVKEEEGHGLEQPCPHLEGRGIGEMRLQVATEGFWDSFSELVRAEGGPPSSFRKWGEEGERGRGRGRGWEGAASEEVELVVEKVHAVLQQVGEGRLPSFGRLAEAVDELEGSFRQQGGKRVKKGRRQVPEDALESEVQRGGRGGKGGGGGGKAEGAGALVDQVTEEEVGDGGTIGKEILGRVREGEEGKRSGRKRHAL